MEIGIAIIVVCVIAIAGLFVRLVHNEKKIDSMTDKEKLAKVRTEIERRYNYHKDHADDYAGSDNFWKACEDRELLSFIDSMQKEPVSEDLEEAANEYAKDYLFTPKPQRAPNIHFINGANWQKEEMMAKAVDAVVKVDAGGYPYVDRTIELYDYDKDIPLAKKGDKYKLILIKEG